MPWSSLFFELNEAEDLFLKVQTFRDFFKADILCVYSMKIRTVAAALLPFNKKFVLLDKHVGKIACVCLIERERKSVCVCSIERVREKSREREKKRKVER